MLRQHTTVLTEGNGISVTISFSMEQAIVESAKQFNLTEGTHIMARSCPLTEQTPTPFPPFLQLAIAANLP